MPWDNATTAMPGTEARNYTTAAQTVKEVGLLQRAEGLANGLEDLAQRLESLSSRVMGCPIGGETKSASQACGLPAMLSEAEARLRKCFNILGALNDQL